MLEPRLKETRATVEFRYRLGVMPLLSRGPLLSGFNIRPKHQGYFRGGPLLSVFNSRAKNERYFREAVTLGAPLLSEFYCSYLLGCDFKSSGRGR